MYSLSFNGIKKPYLMLERGRKKSIFAPVKRNLLSIPGMVGALLDSTDTEVLVITQPVYIKGIDKADLKNLEEDMAAWLITDEPVELIFDDEPNRIYYAVVDGSFEPDHFVNFGRSSITFICPNSRKYGAEDSINFQNTASFPVSGTAKTDPVISCTINKDTTFVAVSNGDKINLIGNPVKQDESPVDPETDILISNCNNLTGWTVSSPESIEYSEMLGTLKTNGEYFYTDDYGASLTSWHGPAVKTSLGEAIQDFRLDVGFYMGKTGNGQAGNVGVSLLDANSQLVANISMTKHFGELDTLYSHIRAGIGANGYDIINEGGQANFKNAFAGVFRIYRKGNVWTGQIFVLVDGKFQSPITGTWTDTDGIATAPVTQVQVRLQQRTNFIVTDQHINQIYVFKLNDINANQVPIIARAGDIIEFDHQTDIIRRNGIDITKEKAFIGEYFPLIPGQNTLDVEPSDCIENAEVRWRPKWL